ncbi:hypothetical protein ACA910_012305 [Epithemia clementina (nom. ined.)]
MTLRASTALSYVWLLTTLGARSALGDHCTQITADWACQTPGFSILCKALYLTNLDHALDGPDPYTIFAPTDDAFDNLPQGVLDALYGDIPALTNILLFHAVEGEVYSSDLECTNLVHMANGKNSRTVCSGEKIFQKGSGNADDDDSMPEIIDTDIPACNGVIHVVNQVMLPPPPFLPAPVPPPSPTHNGHSKNIVEVVCETSGFTKLCAAIQAAGLESELSASGPFTIFAPTDEAFDNLPPGVLEALSGDTAALTNILLFHAVEGKVYSSDLQCTELVPMANGKNSRTVCRDDKIYQKGDGNADNAMPEIIDTDIPACNGVVHVVNQVMLPPMDPVPTVPSKNIVEIACETEGFSKLCSLIRAAELESEWSSSGPWTVFAPNDAAFENLSQGTFDALFTDLSSLTNTLLFHVTPGKVYSSALQCTKLLPMENGKNSRTVCRKDKKYQKGAGNSQDERPELVATDIPATNGVIHVVNRVMLPPPSSAKEQNNSNNNNSTNNNHDQDCSYNIADLVCQKRELTTLCRVLHDTGLDLVLNKDQDEYTLFAPTNGAFAKLPAAKAPRDLDGALNILLFHAVAGSVYYASDLNCTQLLTMANGKNSRTVCRKQEGRVFQKGGGNNRQKMPEIIEANLNACNGVVHVVDQVMLPPN